MRALHQIQVPENQHHSHRLLVILVYIIYLMEVLYRRKFRLRYGLWLKANLDGIQLNALAAAKLQSLVTIIHRYPKKKFCDCMVDIIWV